MTTLPSIMSTSRSTDGPNESQQLFKVGSALDNDESLNKLESNKQNNGVSFKGMMMKSQDISIQKFYENLQNQKSHSQSSMRNKIPKPPKISLEVKKSIRHSSKIKRSPPNRNDRLDNNLYSPANAYQDENRPETTPLAEIQKTFDIASGEITLQNEALAYTIHEILGICLSINFTVLLTGQLWTIFVPTNELVNELLRVCKLKSQYKALENVCAMLLSCTTIEIASIDSKITNGSFASHVFQGYVLQALHVIVNLCAKQIQSFFKAIVEKKQKQRALEKRRKARQSQLLAATRAREKMETLRKQQMGNLGTISEGIMGGTQQDSRKFSHRGSTFSKAARIDDLGTAMSVPFNQTSPSSNSSVVNSNSSTEEGTTQFPPRRPSQRKPATYSQPNSRSTRPSFRNIVSSATSASLDNENTTTTSTSLGIAATFNNANNNTTSNPAPSGNAYYSSYSNNVANSLVNNLRDELSHTLSIFEDEIINLKHDLDEQKLSLFYSRGNGTSRASDLMFAYTPLDQEASTKGATNAAGTNGTSTNSEEVKPRFRSNAFKEGSSGFAPLKSITTQNSTILDAIGNVEVSTLKSDFESLQKKFQALESTLHEQQESTLLVEQKAREEAQFIKENTELMVQNAILATKNEMITKFQTEILEKEKEIKSLQEKMFNVDKTQDEIIEKQVTNKYEEMQKKLKTEYADIISKQEDMRLEITAMIEARQITQVQRVTSTDGQVNIRQSIVFDELDFPVMHHEDTTTFHTEHTFSGTGRSNLASPLHDLERVNSTAGTKRIPRKVIKPHSKNELRESTFKRLDELSGNGNTLLLLSDSPYTPMDKPYSKFHQSRDAEPSLPKSPASMISTSTNNSKGGSINGSPNSKLNPFARFIKGNDTATTTANAPKATITQTFYRLLFGDKNNKNENKLPENDQNMLEQRSLDAMDGMKAPKPRELDNDIPIHPTSTRLNDLLLSPQSDGGSADSDIEQDHEHDETLTPRLVLPSNKDGDSPIGRKAKKKHKKDKNKIIRGGLKDNTGAIKLKKRPSALSKLSSEFAVTPMDGTNGTPVGGDGTPMKDHSTDIAEGEEDGDDDDDDNDSDGSIDSIQKPTASQKAKELAAAAAAAAAIKIDPEVLKQEAASRKITHMIQYHHMLLQHMRNKNLMYLRITALEKLFNFYCQSASTTTTAQDMILSNALELIATNPIVPITHPLFAKVINQYTLLIDQYDRMEGILYPIHCEMFLLCWEKAIPNEAFVEKGLTIVIAMMKLKMRKFLSSDGKVIQQLLSCLQSIIIHYQPLYPSINNFTNIALVAEQQQSMNHTQIMNGNHYLHSPSSSPEKRKSIIVNRSLLPFKVMKLLYKLIEMIYHKLYTPYINYLSTGSSPKNAHLYDVKTYEKVFVTIYNHSLFALLIPLCFEHYASALPSQPPANLTSNKHHTASTSSIPGPPPSSTTTKTTRKKTKQESMEEEKKEIYQQSYEHILKTITILLAMQSLTYLAQDNDKEQSISEVKGGNKSSSIELIWQGNYHLIDYLLIHLFSHTYFTYPTMILSYHWTLQCLINCLVSGQYRTFVTRGMFPAMFVKYLIVLQHGIHYHGLLPPATTNNTVNNGTEPSPPSQSPLLNGTVWEDDVPLTIQRHACQLITPYLTYCIQIVFEQPGNSLVLQYTGIVDVIENLLHELHHILFPTTPLHTASNTMRSSTTVTTPIVTISNAIQSLRMSVFMHALHLLSFLILPTTIQQQDNGNNGNSNMNDNTMASLVSMLGTNHMLPVAQLQQVQITKLLLYQQKIMSILLHYFSYFSTILITTMDSKTVRDSTHAGNPISSPYKEEISEIMERVYALQHNQPVPMTTTTRMLLQPNIVTAANTSHSTK